MTNFSPDYEPLVVIVKWDYIYMNFNCYPNFILQTSNVSYNISYVSVKRKGKNIENNIIRFK